MARTTAAYELKGWYEDMCIRDRQGIRKAENALRLTTMNLCHLIGKPLTTESILGFAYAQFTFIQFHLHFQQDVYKRQCLVLA